MKRRSAYIVFGGLLIALWASYTSCGSPYFSSSKQGSGISVAGNPLAPATNLLLSAICNVVSQCNPAASLSQCQQRVTEVTGLGPDLGLTALSGPYSTLIQAEQSGAIAGNGASLNSCATQITQLSCGSAAVQGAYDPNQSNPYSGVGAIVTASGSCSTALVVAPAELPDQNTSGWFNMAGNLFLLHFDEPAGTTSLTDKSRAGITGTCVTCPAFNVAGKIKTAADFPGNPNDFDFGTPASMDFGASDFTVAAWIKTNYTGSAWNIIAAKKNAGNTVGWDMNIYPNNHTAEFAVMFNAPSPGTMYLYSTSPVNDGAWHHLVGTRQGTTLSLYVDGSLQTTGPLPSGAVISAPGERFFVGGMSAAYCSPGYCNLTAALDELAIWNYALSASQIQSIYNDQKQ